MALGVRDDLATSFTMLVDDVVITAVAGKGGAGKVAFNRTKLSLGPTGGNGGRGGSVIFEGVSDASALGQFRFIKVLEAENGEEGKRTLRDGENGKDLLVKIPVGTVIHNLDTGTMSELVKIGEKIVVARGGNGGKGNFKFRAATRTSPKIAQPGLPGESFRLRLELKLIADVGLVGLPNAGKSSFLNAFTNAKSKVANYKFTTLEPHLGVYYELILADIPGLIEGASGGKGLGTKFLRHIERTKLIFHLLSAESENPLLDYKTVRKELETYSQELAHKKEFVFLNKVDLFSDEEIAQKIKALAKGKVHALPISIEQGVNRDKIEKMLRDLIAEKKV